MVIEVEVVGEKTMDLYLGISLGYFQKTCVFLRKKKCILPIVVLITHYYDIR